jgi:hypothetical protein
MKIWLWIIIIILTCNIVTGWETQLIEIENETISITPTINICENTTSVFKIQRENYTSNNTVLLIKYTQKIISNITQSVNISKTINKYTSSNTGKYNIQNNGNISLIFEIKNETRCWNFRSNCFNESVEKNISINETTTNTSNETNNVTINISIELTNKTINKTNLNNTINKTEEKICPKKLEIKTNKDLFKPGDKLEMNFILDNWINEYKITYHIELLDKTIVKNEYSTKNNNTKTYTVKKSEEKQETHIIIAELESECGKLNAKKIIVVENQIEEKEKQDTIIQLSAVLEKNNINIELIANRGDSAKSVLEIFLENDKRRKVGKGVKISLLNKNSYVKTTFQTNIPEEEVIYVVAEGLGLYEEIKIENNNILIKEKTENTSKTETIQITKINEEKQEIKKTELTKQKIEAKTIIVRNSTKIEPMNEKKILKSKNLLFIIAIVGIIIVGLVQYFKKYNA